MSDSRPLRVFLCHASQDKPAVRELYKRLKAEGWIDPWLDIEKLLPGQDWRDEIEKAVIDSDIVLVCLSNKSVDKEGFVQKEIRIALDVEEEKPEGRIFIIPVRLENCTVPRRLARLHWLDYFDNRSEPYEKLISSFRIRAHSLGLVLPNKNIDAPISKSNRANKRDNPSASIPSWLETWNNLAPQRSVVDEYITNDHDLVAEQPIFQITSTYVIGDDLYSDTYDVNLPDGTYIGQLGLEIADTIPTDDVPKRARAIDVWLFGLKFNETTTAVFMTPDAYGKEATREQMKKRGEPVLIELNQIVEIETRALKMQARVVDVKFGKNVSGDDSFFNRLTLELTVWSQPDVYAPMVDEQSIFQILSTYILGDDLYNQAHSVSLADGTYIGEFGLGIADVAPTFDKPKHVRAIEVWLFGLRFNETTTAILMTPEAYGKKPVLESMYKRGEPIMVEPNQIIEIETRDLKMHVRVMDVVYDKGTSDDSFFKLLTLELVVWPKPIP